jgi:23S rRNA 5-hydroxycytidine C2501 synthase
MCDMMARPLELLAPARTDEIAREAIIHGADAVYIGGPAFGARHNAGNTVGQIEALAKFAHRFHAQVFVTLNIILHDDELEAAACLVKQMYEAGADALIVQDMGLLELGIPPIALHASTQCDIRTPEKATFFANSGFSQLVLARELSLVQIGKIRESVPQDVILEYFVHGALCVAFSGQCYLSHAHTGRSANRGDCSQACRLPYTLKDAQGGVVAYDKHLLSLKDNDQSANLMALIEAGIHSFKIEGRLKDMAYVKNITGHYRRLLDIILEARPDLARASSGRTELLFTPAPDKSFHRGHTDYFIYGRQADIGAFDSPKYLGAELGCVTRILKDGFELETDKPLSNGDGLAYLAGRSVRGMQADVVKKVDAIRWTIQITDPVNSLQSLRIGTQIYRNHDHAWALQLSKPSSQRRIAVDLYFSETHLGVCLRLVDEDGVESVTEIETDKQPSQQPERFERTLREQLCKLGGTIFVARSLELHCDSPWFLPTAQINALRREAVAKHEALRLTCYTRPLRRQEVLPTPIYPEVALSYLANVYNQAARTFYARHGVKTIEAAYEAHERSGETRLMTTKHCLRYAFNLCPKQAKGLRGIQGRIRAEPMILVAANETLTLHFDCKACEMHVVGTIKTHILRSPPPGSGA